MGWNHPNRVWALRVLIPRSEYDKLNRRWTVQGSSRAWEEFWKKMWSGWVMINIRVFIWRLINQGFCTDNRVVRWKVCTRICMRCNLAQETTAHLFHEFPATHQRWRSMDRITSGTSLTNCRQDTLFLAITRAIKLSKKKPTILILVVEICRTTWNERTAARFSQVFCRTPEWVIFQNTENKVAMMHEMAAARWKWAQLQKALNEFSLLLLPCRNTPIVPLRILMKMQKAFWKVDTKTHTRTVGSFPRTLGASNRSWRDSKVAQIRIEVAKHVLTMSTVASLTRFGLWPPFGGRFKPMVYIEGFCMGHFLTPRGQFVPCFVCWLGGGFPLLLL